MTWTSLSGPQMSSEAILQKLKAALEALRESTSWQEVQQKIQEAENLLDKVLSKIFQVVEKVMGLKISNVHILDIKSEVTPDGKGASLSIPITTNVTLTLPLLGELVDLGLQTSVSIETDAKTGVSTVIVEKCTNDPANISLTFPDRSGPPISAEQGSQRSWDP
ncbi:BPI fold-containing family A member 2 [Delphinus delphis]|uniref:BPI fold-containing family A member 2 n=1 Tax=Delphinus delphis TaxID=9728 RepID=UPI0028C4B6DA|nr:BPI fold-containing family A member 2 [Delphinus delphis]